MTHAERTEERIAEICEKRLYAGRKTQPAIEEEARQLRELARDLAAKLDAVEKCIDNRQRMERHMYAPSRYRIEEAKEFAADLRKILEADHA